MPDFSTPSGSNQPYIPLLKRDQRNRVPGTHKGFVDATELQTAVDRERLNISMGLPVWYPAERISVQTEPPGVERRWNLSTTAGNAAADAAASHARIVLIGVKSWTLNADTNIVRTTMGAPASGVGASGDLALDATAGVVYLKTGSTWEISGTLWSGGSSTTVPGAPTIGGATAGDGTVSVTFTAPVSDGGSAILDYQVTLSTGQTLAGSSSPIVVSAPNGTAVTATVRARNALGYSAASAPSNSVTPSASATAPGAPTSPVATAGMNSVSVAFTAPASNGGSAILDYQVTLSTGQTGTGATSPISVSAPAGTAVTATVRARNAVGYSVPSAASNSVTPTADPSTSWTDITTVQTANVTTLGDNQYAGTSAATSSAGRIVTNHYLAANTSGWAKAEFPADGASSFAIAFDTTSTGTLPLNDNDRIATFSATGLVSSGVNAAATAISPSHNVPLADTSRVRFGRDTDNVFKIQESTDSGVTWTTLATVGSATTAAYILRFYCTYSTSVTPNARKLVHPQVQGMSDGVTPT